MVLFARSWGSSFELVALEEYGAARTPEVLADRVARAFGDLRFDLYADASATETPRLLPGEPPALVVPRGFGELSEVEQVAGLAPLLAYVAFDIPWIEELSGDDTDRVLYGDGGLTSPRGPRQPESDVARGADRRTDTRRRVAATTG
jgi:hypothetical protein